MDSLVQRTNTSAQYESGACRGALAGVSVIVPVGAGERAWRSLLGDLAVLDPAAELVFVATDAEPMDFVGEAKAGGLRCRVRWITTTQGRASQMNLGAEHATCSQLWFLHADSRICPGALIALERSLQTAPDALHYFELSFEGDGPWLTRLNAWGARLRSRFLGLPFGDQGLCLSRESFRQLGRFEERARYGEDHLLVWSAHRHGVRLRCVGASIATSARQYQAKGWLRTTMTYAWLTWRQAIPEWWKWVRSRSA